MGYVSLPEGNEDYGGTNHFQGGRFQTAKQIPNSPPFCSGGYSKHGVLLFQLCRHSAPQSLPQIIHFMLGFSITNHPAIGVPLWLWKPPYNPYIAIYNLYAYITCFFHSWASNPFRQHPWTFAPSRSARSPSASSKGCFTQRVTRRTSGTSLGI